MTLPVAHGYPDYARYSAEADVDWLNLPGQSIAVSTQFGSFFLGATKWLGLGILGTTANGRYNFAFFRDAALTKFAGELFVHVRAGHQFRGAIPVNAPYLVVTVDPSANPTVFDLNMWAAAGPMSAFNEGFTNALISIVALVVPAGVNVLGPSTAIYAGPIYWFVQASGTAFFAYLRTFDYVGTNVFLDSINGASPLSPRNLFTPAKSLQIQFNNNSGAALTVDAFCIAHPMQASP